jgi:MinD-like ATPase involved in chromosome partitioning or flagellar assembly
VKLKAQTSVEARTIGIWGPHGSSGKSTIAINLAESLANSGLRVLLVDADLANPSLALMLGRDGVAGRGATLSGSSGPTATPNLQISSVACGKKSFDLFAGWSPHTLNEALDATQMPVLMQQLKDYDRVLFDLSSPIESRSAISATGGRTDLTRFLVGAVDQLIAVGRPDFLGVQRLATLLLDIKKIRKDKSTTVVFNQIAPLPSVHAALDAFELLARDRVSAAIARDDRTLSSALRHGQPARMSRRSARFVSDIDALARQLRTL